MVVMCCRFLCYFCRTSRQNQRAMFEHLSYLLENSSMLLGTMSSSNLLWRCDQYSKWICITLIVTMLLQPAPPCVGRVPWMLATPPWWTTTNWPWLWGRVTWRRLPCTCPGVDCSPMPSSWRRAIPTLAGIQWRAKGSWISYASVSGLMVGYPVLSVRRIPENLSKVQGIFPQFH